MLLHDGLNVGTLLRECAKLRHVAGAGRVGEHAVDFLETAGKLAEFGTHVVVDHDGGCLSMKACGPQSCSRRIQA